MPATAFITVDEALQFSDPTNSANALSAEETTLYTALVGAVCEAMEQYLRRPVVARELTKSSDGGGQYVFLKHVSPGYLSVAGVVEDATTLTPTTDYVVYPETGYVARVASGAFSRWKEGPRIIAVTYTAGVAQTVDAVPENLKLCAKVAFRFYRKMGDEAFGKVMTDNAFIIPDKFPRQCLWLMDPYRLPGGGS